MLTGFAIGILTIPGLVCAYLIWLVLEQAIGSVWRVFAMIKIGKRFGQNMQFTWPLYRLVFNSGTIRFYGVYLACTPWGKPDRRNYSSLSFAR